MKPSDLLFTEVGLQPPISRVAIPGAAQDVSSILDWSVANLPDHEAIVGRFTRYTYRVVEERIRAVVAVFRSLGVRPGDRIAASIGNHPEVAIAFMATQRLGVIWLGINVASSMQEKAHMLRDAGVSVFLAEPGIVDDLGAFRSDLSDLKHVIAFSPPDAGGEFGKMIAQNLGAPDDREAIDPWAPAAIAYTSGTTGFPKGAVHSQHNMALIAAVFANRQPVSPRHGIATPLTILNLMILGPVVAFARGTTVFCIERLFAPEIAEWVGREKITSLNSAPAVIYDMLTRPDIDRNTLRSLAAPGLGAAHVPETLRKLYKDFFGAMTYAYGLTEAPTAVSSTLADELVSPESVGKALSHVEIEIVDGNGIRLGPNQVGEICVGPTRKGKWANVYTPMLGYWKQKEATAEALRGGVLHTGDLGELDKDGNLFIRGRLKDIILRGGATIYAAEIERIILEDARVLYCAVTAKPDVRLGETVAAFVQPKDSLIDTDSLRSSLIERCRAALSKHKVPSDWIFVDTMPRNQMNKIVKGTLRKKYFDAS